MDEIPVSLALAQAAKETGWELRDLHRKEMHFWAGTWSGEGLNRKRLMETKV